MREGILWNNAKPRPLKELGPVRQRVNTGNAQGSGLPYAGFNEDLPHAFTL
jgi:hypothetical protein